MAAVKYDRETGLWMPRQRDRHLCEWHPYGSLATNPDYGGSGGMGSVVFKGLGSFVSGDNSGPFQTVMNGALSTSPEDNNGDSGFHWRVSIPMVSTASLALGSMTNGGCRQVRVAFMAGSSGFIVDHASIGILVPGSANFDCEGTPQELFFNGVSGFTLPAAAWGFATMPAIMSDWVNLSIGPTDVLIVLNDINAGGSGQEGAQLFGGNTPSDIVSKYWTGTAAYNQASVGSAPSNSNAFSSQSVVRVDVR